MMLSHPRPLRSWIFAILALGTSIAPVAAEPPRVRKDPPLSFIEPVGVPHRHCTASCISRGSVQWYCRANQTCVINCSTAPPGMECHGGEE